MENSARECVCGAKIHLSDRSMYRDDKVTDVMSEQQAKRSHKNGAFTRLQMIIRQDNA